MWMTELVTSVF